MRRKRSRKKPTVTEEWLHSRDEREKGAYRKMTDRFPGFSHTHLSHPDPLKGSTFGPAGKVRRVGAVEQEAIESELKKKGLIGIIANRKKRKRSRRSF